MLWSVGFIAALVAVVCIAAAVKPDIFRVHRVARIQAPAEKIFRFIDDFRRWSAWSPYEKLDPAMKRVYSGAPSGYGAVYEWVSGGKAGAGRMEIVESAAAARVRIQLDFFKPFEGHNVAEFTLRRQGASTEVTWAMQGPAPFFSKLMQVFFNMDKMIGKDFETGLANLKSLAESA